MSETAIIRRKLKPASGSGKSFAFVELFRSAPSARIAVIKAGVPAAKVKLLINELHFDQRVMLDALNLKTATVNKKAAQGELLSTEDSERVVGLAKLVGQLEAMIEESGSDEAFDAPEWLSRWLREPLPALGGGKPVDLLDTMEGQALVAQALAQIQSGAYA